LDGISGGNIACAEIHFRNPKKNANFIGMSILFERVEPETRIYLKKILKTMALSLGWMFANVIFGLALELGYVDGGVSVGNIIYYLFSVTCLVLLVIWLVKTWGKGNANARN
jgi:hypothetical protein